MGVDLCTYIYFQGSLKTIFFNLHNLQLSTLQLFSCYSLILLGRMLHSVRKRKHQSTLILGIMLQSYMYLGQLYLIYQTSLNITTTLNHDFSIILLLSCTVLSQVCKNRSLLNCNKQTNAYLNNLNWSENSGGKKNHCRI